MFQTHMFQKPPASYRIQPFWFWNGALEAEHIAHQIKEMADQGVGGFFICARQGLTVPYLSEEWFSKVRLAVDEAKRHGLEVWLYDEYPYPSGIAGGEVILEHPDAKAVSLSHKVAAAKGGEKLSLALPWGKILSAKAVPLAGNGVRRWDEAVDIGSHIGNLQIRTIVQESGLTAYNRKRYFTYEPAFRLNWTAPAGCDWEVHVFQEKEIEDFKYYGTYIDPCHAEAVATFIRRTHDRYRETVGDEFGRTIKGFFTDETGFLGKLPWSRRLPDFFRRTCGYDLLERLHLLLYDGAGAAKVRFDYFECLHRLLNESYHRPISEWCDRHGLKYITEVPCTGMATQRYSHIPGGDSAHEKLGKPLEWIIDRYAFSLRNNPKMVSSAAHQFGRDRALIECFHSVGWSMTLQDAKWMIDRLAAFGINFYNFHAFFFSVDGPRKHDAPPSQFLQNPYWPHFRKLADYAARIAYAMSLGKPLANIAVLNPVATFRVHLGDYQHRLGYIGVDPAEQQRLERYKESWSGICKNLLLHRFDFDHLDPELLKEAQIRDGKIRLGNAEYDVLVLPPMSHIEAEAWERIGTFFRQGGTVVCCGGRPARLIGGEAREPFSVWPAPSPDAAMANGRWFDVPMPDGDEAPHPLIAALRLAAPQAVRLMTEPDKSGLLLHARRLSDGSLIVFASNQEQQPRRAVLELSPERIRPSADGESGFDGAEHDGVAEHDGGGDGGGGNGDDGNAGDGWEVCVDLLNLETGDESPVARLEMGREYRVELAFGPYESRLVRVHRRRRSAAPAPAPPKRDARAAFIPAAAPGKDVWLWEPPADGLWEVRALHANALRFDFFQCEIAAERFDGGDRQAAPRDVPAAGWKTEIKPAVDLLAHYAGRNLLPFRFSRSFGTPTRISMGPAHIRYSAEFTVRAHPGNCLIVMDDSAVTGDFTLEINGNPLRRGDFAPHFVYDPMNRAAEIGHLLVTGTNRLTLTAAADDDSGGLIDPLYLFGNFGVFPDPENGRIAIDAPPAAVALTDRPAAGFPFYAGTLSLKRDVVIAKLPSRSKFILRFRDWPAHFHDCAEVWVNGRPLGVRPWLPYEWEGETGWLSPGTNTLEIRVTNTLSALFEGAYFDYATHRLTPVLPQT
jgi:hypothetical protein